MTETVVSYHRDGYGPGRPAVDVKVHAAGVGFWPDGWDDGDTIAGIPTDDIVQEAQDRVFERFWQDTEIMAEEIGLGGIEQEGRSGGWLVLTDGRDPQEPDTIYDASAFEDLRDPEQATAIREWLAAYRSLSEWCAGQVAACPGKVAALAQQMAMDEAGAATVTIRSWLAWGKEYAL